LFKKGGGLATTRPHTKKEGGAPLRKSTLLLNPNLVGMGGGGGENQGFVDPQPPKTYQKTHPGPNLVGVKRKEKTIVFFLRKTTGKNQSFCVLVLFCKTRGGETQSNTTFVFAPPGGKKQR